LRKTQRQQGRIRLSEGTVDYKELAEKKNYERSIWEELSDIVYDGVKLNNIFLRTSFIKTFVYIT
jgi:hypothetical protein